MKRITKKQQKELDALRETLGEKTNALSEAIDGYNSTQEDAFKKLETAIEEYNDATRGAWEDVETALGSLNETATETVETVQGWGEEITAYVEEKSERWQESDRGEAFIAWGEEFENFSIDVPEIDEPTPTEIPDTVGPLDPLDFDAETVFDELPEEPEV
jgi:hypothetical protein